MFGIGALILWALNTFIYLPVENSENAAYDAGYIVGTALAPLMVVGLVYGVFRLVRRGRPPFRFARVMFWTLTVTFVAGLFNEFVVGTKAAEVRVTDEERGGLQIRADSIVHSVMGFALPSPGSAYGLDTDLQGRLTSELAGHPGVVAWVLRRSDGQGSLVIQATKISPLKETQFRQFTTGVRTGALKAAGTVERDTLVWNGDGGEYELAMRYRNGVLGNMRCVSHTRPQAASLIVCLTTGSAGPDELAFVREGLTLQ